MSKLSNKELQISEARFTNIIEASNTWFWEVDSELNFTYLSKNFTNITGYPLEHIQGKSIFNIRDEQEAQRTNPLFDRIIESRESFKGLLGTIRHADGHILHVESSGIPLIVDGEILGWRGSNRNITKEVEYKKKIEETMVKLKMSNEELEHFAYFASHDLQGPIRQVSSYVKLLKQSKTAHFDKKDAQYIKFIEDSCQHMKTLVTDLLEFSRLDKTKSKLNRIDLNSIFDPILLIFDKQIRENGASLKIGRMPQVMCDPVLISQVFTNLISNALKFKEPNSTPKISISANLNGEFVEFVVRDNGLGIPVEDLENVFSIFHRGQRTSHIKGTGIGLAICRKIVNRHGGEIWISKDEKPGTKIHFTLPEVGVLN